MIKSVAKLNKLLPFVAIGTIADCQSILDKTNRILVKSGLKVIQDLTFNKNLAKNELQGLNSLLKLTGLQQKILAGYPIGSQDLAFYLSPILNSSGRISHAKESIELLISKDISLSEYLAKNLLEKNNQRKLMVSEAIIEVEKKVQLKLTKNPNFLWLEGFWHKGLIGLIASKLVSSYNLPVVVISLINDDFEPTEKNITKNNFDTENSKNTSYKVHASLRSPENYNLVETLKKIDSNLFLKFGGHPQACGFTCKSDQLKKIKKQFSINLANIKKTDNYYLPQNLDLPKIINNWKQDISLIYLPNAEIKNDFIKKIFELEPFGQDFMLPNILLKIENNTQKIQVFGENNNHLKFFINDTIITFFHFFKPKIEDKVLLNEYFDNNNLPNFVEQIKNKTIWTTAKPNINVWNNSINYQLIAEKWFVS